MTRSIRDLAAASPIKFVAGNAVLAMPADSYRALGKNNYTYETVTGAVNLIIEASSAAARCPALPKTKTRAALFSLLDKGFIGGTAVEAGAGISIVRGTKKMTIKIPAALFEAALGTPSTHIKAA